MATNMPDVAAPTSPRDLGPAVRFPPPLLFAVGFGMGALLNRWWPLAAPADLPSWTSLVGGLVIAAGFALALIGVITFRRAKVSVYPNRPARSLVTHGIYAYTRNPMYVGLTVVYLGGVLVTGLIWSLILLPLVLVTLYVTVIRREERHLTERFPAEYADYCDRVRRWI